MSQKWLSNYHLFATVMAGLLRGQIAKYYSKHGQYQGEVTVVFSHWILYNGFSQAIFCCSESHNILQQVHKNTT